MLALLLVPLALAEPSTELVDVWRRRTGLPLVIDASVRAQPAEGGMALVGKGVSLLLAPAASDRPLHAALQGQLAPFVQAGSKATALREVPCTMASGVARCIETSVELAPGASMRLVAAHREGSDWTATCLVRSTASAGLCAGVFALSEKP